MKPIIKKAALEGAASANSRPDDTKISKMAALFKTGISLNRFDAERYGEHCLNSTVSVLRADGMPIHDQWESVPTRFGVTTRVKRYRYIGGAI
jgi:hypothetical protein